MNKRTGRIAPLLLIPALLGAPVCSYADDAARKDFVAPPTRDLTIAPVSLFSLFPSTPTHHQALEFFPGFEREFSQGQTAHPFAPVVEVGMDDGPVLETLQWGGAGALFGSFAGPGGAVVGSAIGATCGFIVGLIVAHRNPPTADDSASRSQ